MSNERREKPYPFSPELYGRCEIARTQKGGSIQERSVTRPSFSTLSLALRCPFRPEASSLAPLVTHIDARSRNPSRATRAPNHRNKRGRESSLVVLERVYSSRL